MNHSSASSKKPRLLFVDDQESILRILSRFGKERGYDFDTADGAAEALSFMQTKTYDCIIIDIKMPEVSGIDLLRDVKELLPDLPVIMVTGNPDAESAAEALRGGAFDYITKPIDFDKLNQTITNALMLRELDVQNRKHREELERLVHERTYKLQEEILLRKETEKELRKSQKDLAHAQRVGRIGNWTWDIVDNSLTWSDEVYRIFGVEKGRFEKTFENIEAMIFEEDRKLNENTVSRIIGKNGANFISSETRIVRSNKEIRWIEQTIEVERDAERRAIKAFGTIQDITDRKNVEIEHVRQSHFLDTLLESIPSPVFYKDRHGRYLGCNRAFEAIVGKNRQEIIGKTVHEVWPERFSETYMDKDLELIRNPGKQQYEFRLLSAKEGEREVIYYKSSFNYPDGEVAGLVGVILDITERKKLEKALIESEDKHREAQKLAKLGHWTLKLDTMIPIWSEEIFNIFGLDPAAGEPSFEKHKQVTHPDDWPVLNEGVTNAVEKGEPFDIEVRIVRPDSSIRWMRAIGHVTKNEAGDVQEVFGTAQDVTEMVLLRNELQENLTKYRTLFETIPLGITVSDKQGAIVESNTFSERLLGLPTQKQRERHIAGREWRIVRPDLTPLPPEEFASVIALKDNRLVENMEMGLVKDKGEITWILVTASPLEREDLGVIIAYQDISNRKKLEQDLRQLSQHLHEATEEVRKSIAREIHDDIGQAMTALKMDLNQFADELSDNLDHLRQIKSMIGLINRCIETVKRLQMELRPNLLDDLGLEETLRWQGREFEKRTNLDCRFDIQDLQSPLNELKSITLFRLFQESLTNIMRHAEAKTVTGRLVEENGDIVLSMSDDGKGIPESKLKDSTSYGLISMRERTLTINGQLHIDSSPDTGTTVLVKIPVSGEGE